MRKLLLIILSCLVFVVPMFAQDDAPFPIEELCTDDGKAFLAEQFGLLAEGLPTADEARTFEALAVMQTIISTYQAQCNGLVFNSEDYDSTDVVIGPVAIPDGTYRVTFEARGFASVTLDALEGDCGLLSLMTVGDLEGGSVQDVWELEGCNGLIDVSASSAWTLTLEPLG